MLPSPSLGPPWLSASPSPAFGPWGIPEELELALGALDFEVDELGVEVVVAAGVDEEDDFVEEEEPPPQPAANSASASTSSAAHARRREDLRCLVMFDLRGSRAPVQAQPFQSFQSFT